MTKQYPPQFSILAREFNVKRTYVSETTSPNPHDCDNCGGMGVMSILCVTDGPFETPPHPYSDNEATFDNGWWVGKLSSFPCPVCKGSCRKYVPKQQYATQKAMGGLGFESQR